MQVHTGQSEEIEYIFRCDGAARAFRLSGYVVDIHEQGIWVWCTKVHV